MPRTFSLEIDERIIALWFQGRPRSYIERELAVSAGKIDNLVKRERQLLGEGNVDALRRLAMAIAKYKYGPVDIQDATRFLNSCTTHCGMKVDAVIEALPRLDNLCRKAGITIEHLPLDLENKVKSNSELEKKKDALRKEYTDLAEKLGQKLKEAGLTDELLAKWKQMSDFLVKHGLSTEEPERIKNLITNAEEAGYDGKALVEKLSVVTSLDVKRENLEEVTRQLEGRQEENKRQLEEQRLQITKNSEMLKEVMEFKSMGCNAQMLRAIVEVVTKVAQANGTTYERALEKFAADLLTGYEVHAGLEASISPMKKTQTDLETSLEYLKMAHSTRIESIRSLELLRSNGIRDSDILSIVRLVEQEGSNFSTLMSRVNVYGSLDNTNRKFEEQAKDLETKRLALEFAVSSLESRKAALEEFLVWAENTVKQQVESMILATRDGSAMIHAASADARDGISNAKEAVISEILSIGERATECTTRYARAQGILTFEPLARAIAGERIDTRELLNPVLVAMTTLLTVLPTRSDSRYPLEAVIKRLKEDIEIDFFA